MEAITNQIAWWWGGGGAQKQVLSKLFFSFLLTGFGKWLFL